MLAFAGLEPGVNDSGTDSHGGRMVKRGSSQLRYVLMNCALPLIRFDMTFATYYARKRAEGKPHRVALSHVAKKLVRVIFALERPAAVFHCLLSAPGASRRKPLLPLITSFLQVCFCEPIPLSMCGYRDAPSSGSHPSPPSSAAALVIIAKKPECDTDRSQCRDAVADEKHFYHLVTFL